MILALLKSHRSYQEIANFVKEEKDELIEKLEIPESRVPSYSTIRRVLIGISISEYESREKSHGRDVTRKTSVFEGKNIAPKNYPDIKRIVKIERKGTRKEGKEYSQVSYYISSVESEAEIMAEKIQGHWLIENCVHWVKDVIFGEDKSRIKGMEVAGKMSLLVTVKSE